MLDFIIWFLVERAYLKPKSVQYLITKNDYNKIGIYETKFHYMIFYLNKNNK